MPKSPEAYEEPEKALLLYSGLQDAYIGAVETYGKPPVACYSKSLTIKALQENFRLSEAQARERYEYEYLQSDYGEATPMFLEDEAWPDVSE